MASVEDIVKNVNAAGDIHRISVQPMAGLLGRKLKTAAHAQGESAPRTAAENAVHALFGGLRDILQNTSMDAINEKAEEAHDMYAGAVDGSEQQIAQDCLTASARTLERIGQVAAQQKSIIEKIGDVEQAVLAALHEGLGEIAAAASVAYVATEDIHTASVDTGHYGHEYVVSLTHR